MAPPPAPPPRVIHNTVHQTVIHLHQTDRHHVQSRTLYVTALSRPFPAAALRPVGPGPEEDDPTRPARAARRLARLLSTESARRVLRPFFREIVHTLIWEGRGRQGRPGHTLLTLWRLAGWHRESREVELRYAVGQRAAAEGLCRLPAPAPSPPVQKEAERRAEADAPRRPAGPPSRPGLGRGEFQALVQGVSAELERRSRLDTLRKGGW